jgi:hypothetical protein
MKMSIKGTVYLVTNTIEFFLPLVLTVGGKAPTTGFAPSNSPYVAKLTFSGGFFGIFQFSFFTNVNTADGTFEFNIPDLTPFGLKLVALSLSLYNVPIYRSEHFAYSDLSRELNIYLYQPRLPSSDGITAGQVSSALSGHGLPGNTSLTASSSGLSITGSKSGAHLQFGVAIVPDTSPNLSLFFDLLLNGWNIHVGFPADLCESANDVLNSIRSGLQSADSAANGVVQSQLMTILQGTPLNLSSGEASNLLQNVSIQFSQVSFPANHNWALSNKSDTTVVISPTPVIGYPRRF